MVKTKRRIDQIPDHLKLTEKEKRDYLNKFKIKVETLNNGTPFISLNCPYPDKQYTYIDARFRTGAWDDPINGLAHFTEHAIFLGCPIAKTQHENNIRPQQGGYNFGAGTDFPYTEYRLEASSGLIESKHYGILYGLDHLLSAITKPYVPESAIENEKKVIADEYQRRITNLDSMTKHFIWEQILPAGHPHLYFITGTDITIKNIDAQTIKNYIKAAYVPNNALLSIYSEGNSVKHEKVTGILKNKWIETMKNKKGTCNTFPDSVWLSRHQNLKSQKIYSQVLPIKKNRVTVSLVKIFEIDRYSRENEALFLASNLLRRNMFDSLRTEGYGYDPQMEFKYIPFVDLGFSQTTIELDSSKVGLLKSNLKEIFKRTAKKIIDCNYHIVEIKKQKLKVLNNPITYSNRFSEAFYGLYRFNQVIRFEDLQKVVLSVTPEDVKYWLEDFAEDPGNLFIVGDIK
jgi:hypothetical protein